MHDIDRTRAEYEWDIAPSAGEYEFEATGDTLGESEYGYEYEGALDEAEVMELAAELLEVTNEAELDQFLGDIFKKVSRTVGKVMKSPIAKNIFGALKGVAKTALPIAGGALGSMVLPGVGTALGSSLGSMAGNMFGLELEGLSNEDQEFEVAKRFTEFATEAAKQATNAPANVPPQQAASQALTVAAQKFAPGLLSGASPAQMAQRGGMNSAARTGRWIRRGNHIILIGAH